MPVKTIIGWSVGIAATMSCGSAPTDHLGGVTPADVVSIALAAGLTCSPAGSLRTGAMTVTETLEMMEAEIDTVRDALRDAYTTECGTPDEYDANGRVTFGGATTARRLMSATSSQGARPSSGATSRPRRPHSGHRQPFL